jgi:hypothetical protein
MNVADNSSLAIPGLKHDDTRTVPLLPAFIISPLLWTHTHPRRVRPACTYLIFPVTAITPTCTHEFTAQTTTIRYTPSNALDYPVHENFLLWSAPILYVYSIPYFVAYLACLLSCSQFCIFCWLLVDCFYSPLRPSVIVGGDYIDRHVCHRCRSSFLFVVHIVIVTVAPYRF